MFLKTIRFVSIVSSLFLFIACGGSDNPTDIPSSQDNNRINPVTIHANAGLDRTVTVNKSIILKGSGNPNDGKVVKYKWEKGTTLLATTASFTYTPTKVGKETLTLIITYDDGSTASDTVVITVKEVVHGNQPPLVNAGVDKTVEVNKSITLTGTASDSDGIIVNYSWTKGNTVLATTASFTYTPTTIGKEILTFTVTDNDGAKKSDTIIVTVNRKGIIKNFKPFILTVETSNKNQISFTTNSFNYKYQYNIDWGDGSIDKNVTSHGIHEYQISHTYSKKGVYTIQISGSFPALNHSNGTILSIEQWGDIKWKSMYMAFSADRIDASKMLAINAIDIPNLSDVTNIANMFTNCRIFNNPVGHWNVSNITLMNDMFRHATSFNQNLNDWDVSKVKDMGSMFSYAESFNQNLNSWDVSNVTNMMYMFSFAKSFNQDITSWDVSNVIYMLGMFTNATSFNQDISSWDISNVTTMNGIFDNATSFNQDLSSWDFSKVEGSIGFNNSGLSISNYDKLLISLAKQDLQNYVIFEAQNLQYSKAGESARFEIINKYAWQFDDGGLAQ